MKIRAFIANRCLFSYRYGILDLDFLRVMKNNLQILFRHLREDNACLAHLFQRLLTGGLGLAYCSCTLIKTGSLQPTGNGFFSATATKLNTRGFSNIRAP
jgi:hypothetical protein